MLERIEKRVFLASEGARGDAEWQRGRAADVGDGRAALTEHVSWECLSDGMHSASGQIPKAYSSCTCSQFDFYH